ncbi:sugar ABC transporter ATP-binding protein [Spirochaetia bacterium]|nr:sugar ABC transporter ATP-binding protein [Spirochaetia bacterium]
MVELKGIQKYFPSNGVTALDGADFDLRPGEIHALLGENGAGKSTLMHVMAGYLKPGAGHILIDGKERRLAAPTEALQAGVGMVRQHPHMAAGFTLWEDCILGAEPHFMGIVNRRKARETINALSERWGFNLPLDKTTETLTISQRQKAAVLALLFRKTDYLIFDEVTAVLSPGETAALLHLFDRLRAEGKGIVIISHKLEETLGIADRVSVLRKGKTVTTLAASSLDYETVGALMFGSDRGGVPATAGTIRETAVSETTQGTCNEVSRAASLQAAVALPLPASSAGLLVRGLAVELRGRPFIRNVDIDLPPGKIVGIAGVRDSGLETLELGITGFLRPSGGKITLGGRDIGGKGTRAFRDAGGAYISADRVGFALAPVLRLRDTIIIHLHRRSRRGVLGALGIMDRQFIKSRVGDIMAAAGVEGNPRGMTGSLSGGMQQRIILAREFAEDAAVLVLAEPGWGLDRSGRERLNRELRAQVQKGKAALLFSTDLDELLSLSDEILVLRNGEFSDRIPLDGGTSQSTAGELKERIGRAMIGGSHD